MTRPLSFLLKAVLRSIQAVITLLKSGNIEEAEQRLEELENILNNENEE